MKKEGNAKWHLNYVCPIRSKWRRSFRDPKRQADYLWKEEWKKGNYNFSRDFGVANWLRCPLGLNTDLIKYQKQAK
jgi:hypothetical protein